MLLFANGRFLQTCGKLRGFVQSVQFLYEVLAHSAVLHFLVSFDFVQDLFNQVFLFHILFSIKIIKLYYNPLILIFDYINKELPLLMSNQN